MKAITMKVHFPPPFIDQFVKWLAGHLYFCVFGSYSSYNHYPLDPGKPEHTILTFAFGVFAYCCMPSRPCNTPAVGSLAEDCKLNVCGRQLVVTFSFYCHLIWFCLFCFCFCCGFQEICLLFKFTGALSYVTPNLHHPINIVFLVTLGTMCHFSFIV
jgi:hypothetical protein